MKFNLSFLLLFLLFGFGTGCSAIDISDGSYDDSLDPDGGFIEESFDSENEVTEFVPEGLDLENCSIALGGSVTGVHIIRFESESPRVRVHLVREYESAGNGLSSRFVNRLMLLQFDDTCHVVSEPDLSYHNSHHNSYDAAYATVNGVKYELLMHQDVLNEIPDDRWILSLNGFSVETSDRVYGPVDLTVTGAPLEGIWPGPSWFPVRINEFMPANILIWQDDHDEYDSWIELRNISTDDLDLEGFALSNDPDNRMLWIFPAGVTIPAGEYLVVAADNQPGQGDYHTNFSLSAQGGYIMLTSPNGSTLGERAYGPQANDVSLGLPRVARDEGYQLTAAPTPGAENSF